MEEETFYPGTVQEAHQAGRELVSKEAASGKPQGGKAPTECGARYEADQAKLLRNRENEHGRLLLLFWHCGKWEGDAQFGQAVTAVQAVGRIIEADGADPRNAQDGVTVGDRNGPGVLNRSRRKGKQR